MGNYNHFAEEYARRTEELERETRDHFYSLLPNLEGKLLLDVGCGSGHDARYYIEKRAVVSGLDISDKVIEMATRTVPKGEFRVGDMRNLPYTSNQFDVITSFYALQASEDVPKSLREMVRVTKPNGTIVILAKHPMRNMLEGWKNNNKTNYYEQGDVTSHILNRTITLTEPSHTLMEYLNPNLLQEAQLELFEEHSDFPASDRVIDGLTYPTYFIMKLRKRGALNQ
jgi:ubiquinone/menaquinone biosynthesis C-methylase UbiE